jgi:hypothetical protein
VFLNMDVTYYGVTQSQLCLWTTQNTTTSHGLIIFLL